MTHPFQTASEVSKLGLVRDDITEATALECLAELDRRYKQQAEPYIAAIANIKAMQTPPSIVMDDSGGVMIWGPGPSQEVRDQRGAKIVRQALERLSELLSEAGNESGSRAAYVLSTVNHSDALLCRFHRMLK